MTDAATKPGPAVITGGARGLGYSLATALARTGSAVALLDILPDVEESAARIAAEFGVEAVGLRVDVTDRQAVAAAFDTVTTQLGVPRTLLTAAGITVWNDSVDVSAEEWRKVMSVNLDGTFFAAQAFGRGLLDSGQAGSAIFVASMSGSIVNVPQFQASYNASKAAVSHLAKSLAVEWAPSGIRVNSISPGYFLSDMTRQFTEQNPELARDWVARIPLGRMGEPEDLHGLVAFLASDASGYLTGQDLIIDGGYTAI
ncbi:SDR family oxidoreductase [Leucobacter japonicus]|uniref:SDR family oxidoreductase n=1 Tax=Leucobacter japonicus TaxID=1461259 RepID=UPI0006A75BD9|nr:SDR family oxidoreductase [Leucobacter japonicus]